MFDKIKDNCNCEFPLIRTISSNLEDCETMEYCGICELNLDEK
jgi:hypothetical protein